METPNNVNAEAEVLGRMLRFGDHVKRIAVSDLDPLEAGTIRRA